MAISAGVVSTEKSVVNRYVGIGSVSVLAINPKKEELSKIYGTEITSDPVYIGEAEINGKKVKTARIDFVVKHEDTGMITKVSYFLRDHAFYNKNNDKVQMINKYGETCWLSFDDAKNANTPSFVSPDGLRAVKIGESELIDFIKAWANVKNRVKFDTKLEIDNVKEAECMIDKMDNLFKGDFKELQSYVKVLSDHKLKVLFGVKTSDEGKIYQDAFIQKVARNGSKVFNHIEKALIEAKARGAYRNTIFEMSDLKKFEMDVKASGFEKSEDVFGSNEEEKDDLPF